MIIMYSFKLLTTILLARAAGSKVHEKTRSRSEQPTTTTTRCWGLTVAVTCWTASTFLSLSQARKTSGAFY